MELLAPPLRPRSLHHVQLGNLAVPVKLHIPRWALQWFEAPAGCKALSSLLDRVLPKICEEGKQADLQSLKALHPTKEQWEKEDSDLAQLTYCFRATDTYHVLLPPTRGDHYRGFSTTKFSVSVMAVPGGQGPKPPIIKLDEKGNPVSAGGEGRGGEGRGGEGEGTAAAEEDVGLQPQQKKRKVALIKEGDASLPIELDVSSDEAGMT